MSKLSQLREKPERVKIGDIELDIYPFTIDDLASVGVVGEDANPAQVKKMIEIVLRKSIPDATDEEINNFPIRYVEELSQHIERINSVTIDADSRLREKLKNAKSAGTG